MRACKVNTQDPLKLGEQILPFLLVWWSGNCRLHKRSMSVKYLNPSRGNKRCFWIQPLGFFFNLMFTKEGKMTVCRRSLISLLKWDALLWYLLPASLTGSCKHCSNWSHSDLSDSGVLYHSKALSYLSILRHWLGRKVGGGNLRILDCS